MSFEWQQRYRSLIVEHIATIARKVVENWTEENQLPAMCDEAEKCTKDLQESLKEEVTK